MIIFLLTPHGRLQSMLANLLSELAEEKDKKSTMKLVLLVINEVMQRHVTMDALLFYCTSNFVALYLLYEVSRRYVGVPTVLFH